MPVLTPNYGLFQPLVNSSTDENLWGGFLNTTIGDVDGLLLNALNFVGSIQTSATFNVTAPTSGSTTIGSTKALFLCNATSTAIAGSLPSASSAGNGFTVAFKKTDSSANAVTIAVAGSDTIDGAASYSLPTQYAWVILSSDGTSAWNILSYTPPNVTIVPQQFRHAFLISGTSWTSPVGTTLSTIFKLTLVAGGGAGSVGQGNWYGAAGATGIKYLSGLAANTAYAISVGSAGIYNGANGGNTTFNDGTTIYTAGGGENGGGSPPSGGVCTNCDISITGQTPAQVPSGTTIGTGGSSLWGSGSGTGSGGSGPPTGYGSAGGFEENGRPGMILIEYTL